jgi:hypothetical protein
VQGGESILNSHPNTTVRVNAATKVLREQGIAPQVLMQGLDFHIEDIAGTSVMKDFFHFEAKLAPLQKVAELLAKIHASPTAWYEPLREKFLAQNKVLEAILRPMPSYAPCWCLPWSAFDTGMPFLGMGNPSPTIAKKILELEIETGVFKKIMQCSVFSLYQMLQSAKLLFIMILSLITFFAIPKLVS